MADSKLLTQSEYAKHRGCSAVAVHQAIKEGRISTIDGKIDAAVADVEWAKNTRARVSASRPDAAAAPGGQTPAGTSPDKDDGYWEARSRREKAEAAIAEMRQAEMEGSLIRVDAVRAAWAKKIAATRDALLQIPARMAPVLAAESDMEKVVDLLDADLRLALAQLSESKPLTDGA